MMKTATTHTMPNAMESRNAVFITDHGSIRTSRSRARRRFGVCADGRGRLLVAGRTGIGIAAAPPAWTAVACDPAVRTDGDGDAGGAAYVAGPLSRAGSCRVAPAADGSRSPAVGAAPGDCCPRGDGRSSRLLTGRLHGSVRVNLCFSLRLLGRLLARHIVDHVVVCDVAALDKVLVARRYERWRPPDRRP